MRDNRINDLEVVMSAEIAFVDDVNDSGWVVGQVDERKVYARMGDFPDEDLWSLWLGDGRWMDFTELPANWTITRTAGGWVDSARPRLPKGEFHA